MNLINHIGFIMDGNGRWAKKQNRERTYGHEIGSNKIKEVLIWCKKQQVKTVSMYAFSLENWKRSKIEVNFLMDLISKKITNKKSIEFFNENNIRFIWNGFEEKLSQKLIDSLKSVQEKTKNNNGMNFQLLFNYGSHQKIIEYSKKLANSNLEFTIENFKTIQDPYNLGELDLVIRTSNEKRLSNFMLWEASYAEFVFTAKHWPEYDEEEFINNIEEYKARIRRYGGLK